MRINAVLIILLNLCIIPSFAQQGLITCNSERNQDNSLSIYADNRGYGEYTIKVEFSSLSGYTTNSIISRNAALAVVERGKKEILKFTQEKNAGMYSFQYIYRYYPGRALRRSPDSTFAYLLPANAGNNLRISNVSSLEERLGQKKTQEMYWTGFIYKYGDTICASRAGLVYDCNEAVKEGESLTVTYKSDRNNIAIQHKDGTIARYSFLAPIKLLVGPGDYVVPGQSLAVFNKESEKYMVLFSTYYLDEKKVLADNNNSTEIKKPSSFVYMPAHFYADENNKSVELQVDKQYTVQLPKELIAAEMSKKDKKRLGLQ